MKNHEHKNKNLAISLLAGATALVAGTAQVQAQSADALIDKLVQKGILTTSEAKDLREETDQDFKTAFQAKMGTPDWVTGYKFYGDFRGRFEQFSGDNPNMIDRTRFRYRLRFGVTASMMDNLEAGFRLASSDAKGIGSQSSAGNSLSANSTMQDNFTRKGIYVDAAYGKWTVMNSGGWLLAATVGKFDNPFNFTQMVFDPDLNPEGLAITGGYTFNDHHNITFTTGAFVMDELSNSTLDPFMYGGQVIWNAKWSQHIASSLGVGGFQIVNAGSLTTNNVPYVNQGNTRNSAGVLMNNFNPIIADASVTYTFDHAPLYNGSFPVKLGAEYIVNPAASQNNQGYWVGVMFGKAGTKKTWDISYRYEALQADAWYDQMVDDDNGAFWAAAPSGGGKGYFGGTNVRGHLIRLDYSFTDSLTFSAICYLNTLINTQVYNSVNEPQSGAMHFMADLMWKF